jgi:hypothetical protein
LIALGTVKKSRIVFDGTQEDLKENKDVKGFHTGLSEVGENILIENTSEEVKCGCNLL